MKYLEMNNNCDGHKNEFSALTPFLIPPVLRHKKVQNLGDGFILNAIERLIGKFSKKKVFSPRIELSHSQIEILKRSKGVILAGANQLNDYYRIWPELTAEEIRSNKLRFIPFGIGLHGEPGFTDKMSSETIEILKTIHENLTYSSWRCPQTVKIIVNQIPEIKDKLLMTGCPVTYDKPLLEETIFRKENKRVAVTVTDRKEFWEREKKIIDFVANRFAKSERFLVLHQNFSKPRVFESLKHKVFSFAKCKNPHEMLRWYAVKKNFKIIIPKTVNNCLKFYKEMDLHIGSRLHAHLLFLSQNKWTFLVPVDGRALGFSDYLRFPLCDPSNLDEYFNFNFEEVRENAKTSFSYMKEFLKNL